MMTKVLTLNQSMERSWKLGPRGVSTTQQYCELIRNERWYGYEDNRKALFLYVHIEEIWLTSQERRGFLMVRKVTDKDLGFDGRS